MIYDSLTTSIGKLRFVLETDGTLTHIVLTDDLWQTFKKQHLTSLQQSRDIAAPIRRQMSAYLSGEITTFDIPVRLYGTSFQKQVWQALRDIPYGGTRSYSYIATSIDRPKAVRAVGYANAINPIPIIFPCHRVLGKNNTLTGYAGGLDMKKALLHLEGVVIE